MKVKIKGLVFVGFAAAILSANAMAVDNTVTSKEYVDTHFQEKVGGGTNANKLVQATSTAGTVSYVEIGNAKEDIAADSNKVVTGNAVAAALEENGGQVNNGELSITVNNTTRTFTANQSDDTTFSITGLEETANKLDGTAGNGISDTDASNEGTAYPSAKAVKDYVAAELSDSSNVGDGTINVQLNGTTKGTFTVNQDGDATINVDGVEVTSNKTQTVAATGSTSNDKYPSETAVRTAIDAVSTAAADAYQAKSTADLQIGTTGGVFRDMTDAEKAALASGITSEKVGDYDEHIADADIHVTTTDKTNWNAKVDTARGAANANKTLVTDANGNVTVSSITTAVIPAIDPSICNATTPCALVTNESTGAAEWQPIAQASANVGA